MFEDVLKERPDIRERLKTVFMDDLETVRDNIEIEIEDHEKYVDIMVTKLEEKIDTMLELYLEDFTVDEIDSIIAWRSSALAEKYTEFQVKKINPIVVEISKEMFSMIVEDELKKAEEEEEREWQKTREEMEKRAAKLAAERKDKEWST